MRRKWCLLFKNVLKFVPIIFVSSCATAESKFVSLSASPSATANASPSPELAKELIEARRRAGISRQKLEGEFWRWTHEIGIAVGDAFYCQSLQSRAQIVYMQTSTLASELQDTIAGRAARNALEEGVQLGSPGMSCVQVERGLALAERNVKKTSDRMTMLAELRERVLHER